MAIFKDFKNWISDSLNKQAGVLNIADNNNVSNLDKPLSTTWFFTAPYGQPRGTDISKLREFSLCPWVTMVKFTINKEVTNTPWKIVAKDESEDEEKYKEMIDKVKYFIDHPNTNGDDFDSLCKPMLNDISEIDAGVWVKVFTDNSYEEGKEEIESITRLDGKSDQASIMVRKLKPFGERELVEIYPADGGSFLIKKDRFNNLISYYQYSWIHPISKPRHFDKDAICYFMLHPRSYNWYGWSPLQSVTDVCEVLIQSTRYNREFFKNNAIPDMLINTEELNIEQLKKLQAYWNKELQNKPHKIAFMNLKGLTVEKFNMTSKDMEWLAGQKWYMHLVFGAYGVSPAEAGFYDDVNRASSESQERITVKNAIKPYYSLIESKINRQIIPELLQMAEPPIMFKWFPEDTESSKLEHQQRVENVREKILTINEARGQLGLENIENDYADNPFQASEDEKQMQQETNLFNSSKNAGKPASKDKPQNSNSKDTPFKKSGESFEIEKAKNDLVEPEDMISEADDYKTFYVSQINKWEKKILREIDKQDIANKSTTYMTKTFGSFLSALFNTINTLPFVKRLKVFVKRSMQDGHDSAEQETGLDIEMSEQFESRVDWMADQSLNGYTIDGKKWHGIKGASEELRMKIYREIQDGVVNKESNKEIKGRIEKVFDSAKEGQAVRIARTETNRFVNAGKMQSYVDSGVEGKKQWMTLDPCPICSRLENKKVGLTEMFKDFKTGNEYLHPPAHPNCTCSMDFVFGSEAD